MTTTAQILAMADDLDKDHAFIISMAGSKSARSTSGDAAALLRKLAEERAWRYMETAPKDGTEIILRIPCLHEGHPDIVAAAHWVSDAWYWANQDEGDYHAEPIICTNAEPTGWKHLPPVEPSK